MLTLKEARNYAYDLVADGKTQYHMLDTFEKAKLTGFIMQATDKIHIWEYITESDYKNELPDLLAQWLTNGGHHTPIEFVLTLKKNALEYASKEAIRILEEQEKEWEYEKQFNKN